jgi:hypothetical protein
VGKQARISKVAKVGCINGKQYTRLPFTRRGRGTCGSLTLPTRCVLGIGQLALSVSAPATFLVVQPFHRDDLVFAILAVLLIGFAAVVCRLMTLILREFTRYAKLY